MAQSLSKVYVHNTTQISVVKEYIINQKNIIEKAPLKMNLDCF